MARIIIAARIDSDVTGPAIADISYGGVYFFLYPDFLSLAKEAGQMIDPQHDALFVGKHLDQLESCLAKARQRACAQPESWDQKVGSRLPNDEPWLHRTLRKEVLALLDQMLSALPMARQQNKGLALIGE